MDQLLTLLGEISVQLLPILGVVVLIFIIVLLKRALDVMKQVSSTVVKVNSTIDAVDKGINELQGPLQTLTRISGTVGLVQDVTENAFKTAIVAIAGNYSVIKDYLSSFIEKWKPKEKKYEEKVNEAVQQPTDIEDAVKGE